MIVSVIGLGYIGLPTAAVLASKGVKVVGVDINQHAVDTINKGKIHIIEPELDVLVHEAVQNNYLTAVIEPEKSDVFMVAVPTPFRGNYEPDLSYIKQAAKSIATVLEKGNLIILESTSPVGTTEKMMEWMREERPDLSFPEFGNDNFEADISVAHCPERVLPGYVVRELVENDRIIGGVTNRCAERAKDLYKFFVKADCLVTDCRTAELSKLVENSFRDVNIAFANELSILCDKMGIDVWELIEMANKHPRVNILQPGCGVGGHCIAVDPWFIVNSFPEDANVIRTAREINDFKPEFVINKIKERVKGIENPKVACLGLAFKPNIDDLRESPAINIAKKLAMEGINILAVEPNIDELPSDFSNIKNISLSSLENSKKNCDLLVILVGHKEFTNISGDNVLSWTKI